MRMDLEAIGHYSSLLPKANYVLLVTESLFLDTVVVTVDYKTYKVLYSYIYSNYVKITFKFFLLTCAP